MSYYGGGYDAYEEYPQAEPYYAPQRGPPRAARPSMRFDPYGPPPRRNDMMAPADYKRGRTRAIDTPGAPIRIEDAERAPLGAVQRVLIPTHCVSGIIGKKGVTIQGIRKTSGATIKIQDVDKEKEDKMETLLVTVIGNEQSVRHAVQLLAERVEFVAARAAQSKK